MTDAELVRKMTDMYLKAYQDAVKEYQRLWDLIDDVSTGKKKPPSFYDTPEKIAKWKQGFIRSQFRQENVVANIAKKLAEVGVDVRPVIKSYIHDVYRYNRELAIGGIKRAVNVNFDQYDKRQIDILLDDEQPVFSKIAYRNLGKNGIIVERLQREFAAGIINGDDKTKMLKRVQKVTGQSRYQAWRVSQTERTRVSSQARDRVINEAAVQGVIVLKEWSTRMRNSREAHISLDGQRVASGEVFHVNPENDVISRSKKNGVRLGTGYDIAYPGDPSAPARAVCNCFCVLIPRVEKKTDKPIEQGGTAEQIEVKPEDITAKRGEDVTLEQKPVTATQEQQTEPIFKPSTTLEEAEKYASNNFVDVNMWASQGVSFSGISLESANVVNEQMMNFYSTFKVDKFSSVFAPAGNTKFGKLVQNAHAAFNTLNRAMLLNRKSLKSPNGVKKALVEEKKLVSDYIENPSKFKVKSATAQKILDASKTSGRATVPDNLAEIINHECGHALEKALRSVSNYDRIRANQSKYAENISGYATTNFSEYVAESFCSWMKGENVADLEMIKGFNELRR